MQKLIFFKIFLVFSLALFSCQSDNVTYEQESQSESVTPCNFQYVTQMQIDSFLKNSFTLVTKVLSNPNFEQNYEIFQSMNPKTVEFAANELRFDIQLVTNPYFSQVVSQAKNSEVLKECLAQRAIELGLVDKLYRDLGVNASSRKCSFGFVAWNVGVSALEIAAGCEIVVVCPLALANAAERAYNIFCCWHCG